MVEYIVGGGILLWLFLSGDDKKSSGGNGQKPVAPPKPTDVEKEVFGSLEDELAKNYSVTDAGQMGADEGWEVGWAYGANNIKKTSPAEEDIPMKFPSDPAKQAAYRKGYLAAYPVGNQEGLAEFKDVSPDAPSGKNDGGSFGKQPGKDTGGYVPGKGDTTTSRGLVMGLRRPYARR